MPVVDRIHEQIATRRLLDRPFYTSWSKGELSREALWTCAELWLRFCDALGLDRNVVTSEGTRRGGLQPAPHGPAEVGPSCGEGLR